MSKRVIKCSRTAEINIVTTAQGKTIIIDEPEKKVAEKPAVQTDYNSLTKKQISKLLDKRGIEHSEKQLKADLIKLLVE